MKKFSLHVFINFGRLGSGICFVSFLQKDYDNNCKLYKESCALILGLYFQIKNLREHYEHELKYELNPKCHPFFCCYGGYKGNT